MNKGQHYNELDCKICTNKNYTNDYKRKYK